MAVNVTNDPAGAGNDFSQAAAPHVGAPGATNGPDFFGLLNTFTTAALGENIEQYIARIAEVFSKNNVKNIAIKPLPDPNGAQAIICGNAAIILIFTDMITAEPPNLTPLSAYGKIAEDSLRRMIPEIKLLNVILVTREDYPRATQMAMHLNNCFAIATDEELSKTNIGAFTPHEFVIEPDVNAARHLIDSLNPHTIQPRVDIGFILYVKNPRRVGLSTNQAEDMLRPIAAVGGFTEMIADTTMKMQGTVRFIPTIRITSVVSMIPLAGMIPMLLALAADQFTDGPGRASLWRQQFNTFDKSKPNLGRLIAGEKSGSLWFANDLPSREEFIAKYCAPAVLALDVVDGVARIPSLAIYADHNAHGKIYDYISQFFGTQFGDKSQPPCQVQNVDYAGYYGGGGGTLLDSRYVDYLSLVSAQGVQDQSAMVLLDHYNDPTIRARIIAERTGTFKSMYRCSTVVMSGALMSMLCHMIQSKQLRISSVHRVTQAMGTDWLTAQATFYATNPFSASQMTNRGGGFNGVPVFNV